MKFLYLVKRPLTQRDWMRYGIGFMVENGHSVTVLDLSDVIHPDLPNDRDDAISDGKIDLIVIRDWNHFEAQQPLFRESDLVIFLLQSYGLSRITYKPLKLIKKFGAPYLVFSPALYPGWQVQVGRQSFSQYLKDLWTRFRNIDPVNSLLSRFPPALLGVPMADYMVKRSLNENSSNSLVGPHTKIIESHTDDYEIYLEEKKRNPKTMNQAVFLDQFMPYHVDFLALNTEHIDAGAYYDSLRRLFGHIERELKLDVVIAAHPRADYHKRPGLFGDRRVVSGKTARMVAESRLVLVHNSASVGLAIMFKKPVMVLTCKALYHYHVHEKQLYIALSQELGTPLRFFDDPETTDLSDAFAVNSDLYDRHIKTYMKYPNAPPKPLWRNVLETVEGAS